MRKGNTGDTADSPHFQRVSASLQHYHIKVKCQPTCHTHYHTKITYNATYHTQFIHYYNDVVVSRDTSASHMSHTPVTWRPGTYTLTQQILSNQNFTKNESTSEGY